MFTKTIQPPAGGTETRVLIWDSVGEIAGMVAAEADAAAMKAGGKQWNMVTVREYKTDEHGVHIKDEKGKPIVEREVWTHQCGRSEFIGRAGLEDFDGAAKAALSAWPEGIQIVEQMLEEIYRERLPVPETTRRRRVMSRKDGQMLDIERLRAGKAFWKTNKRRRAVGPTHLTIVTDVSAKWDVDHRDIMWRGAASIALMDVLERAGYRCEHWAAKRTKKIGSDVGTRKWVSELQAVRTKCQGEPLDVMAQVNTVSGWFMRTILFGAKSLTGNVRLQPDLGDPARMTDDDIREITSDSRVLVSQGIESYRDAVGWVSGCVERYIKQGRVGEGSIDRGERGYYG